MDDMPVDVVVDGDEEPCAAPGDPKLPPEFCLRGLDKTIVCACVSRSWCCRLCFVTTAEDFDDSEGDDADDGFIGGAALVAAAVDVAAAEAAADVAEAVDAPSGVVDVGLDASASCSSSRRWRTSSSRTSSFRIASVSM